MYTMTKPSESKSTSGLSDTGRLDHRATKTESTVSRLDAALVKITQIELHYSEQIAVWSAWIKWFIKRHGK